MAKWMMKRRVADPPACVEAHGRWAGSRSRTRAWHSRSQQGGRGPVRERVRSLSRRGHDGVRRRGRRDQRRSRRFRVVLLAPGQTVTGGVRAASRRQGRESGGRGVAGPRRPRGQLVGAVGHDPRARRPGGDAGGGVATSVATRPGVPPGGRRSAGPDGENRISVAPGANAESPPQTTPPRSSRCTRRVVLASLERPQAAVRAEAAWCSEHERRPS